jgi:hypothetical protein
VLVAYMSLRAPLELRLFTLIALVSVVGGLAFPLGSAPGMAWDIFVSGRSGERYFFLAQVAWVVILIWAAAQIPKGWLRGSAWLAIGASMASGIVYAWSYPAFIDYKWSEAARNMNSAPPGKHLVITIPPGLPWTVDITVR